ncbi:MAG: tetratricopeptide repeat protein [Candidatus Sumerlaeaceae bacterium]|nr:tetratricopeptide repeat protein [Candidatus Sumerlaeaceae bacterium]
MSKAGARGRDSLAGRLAMVACLAVTASFVTEPSHALKATPERRQAIDLLAKAQQLEAAGKFDEAAQIYAQSVQLAPSPAGYLKLGQLYAKAGQKDNARENLNKALEMNPDYELARMELANLGRGGKKKTEIKTVADGGAAAAAASGGAMNVDRLQQENETMRSLSLPDTLRDVQAPEPVTNHGYFAMVKSMVSKAPQNPKAGSTPAVPAAPQQNGIGTKANTANEPQQDVVMEQDSNPVVIDNSTKKSNEGAGKPAGSTKGQVVIPRKESSTGSTPEAPAAPAKSPDGLPPPPVSDSPEIKGGAAPEKPASGGGQAAETQSKPAAQPTAAEINAAAFSPEAKQQPGSIVFNNDKKVALGTFAFHRDRGDSYRDAERWQDAAVEYETALKENPTDVETRVLYAEALARTGRGAEAADHFSKAEQLAPNDGRVFYRLGNLYRGQGKTDQAIGAYRRSLELDDSNKFAHNNLGVVYMEKGDYAKALKEFQRVVELDPNYDKAILNLGIIYDDHLQDKEQAKKYYEMYMKSPGDRKVEVQRWLDSLK